MKVGIDIGTSYSSIAIINEDGIAEPVRVSNGACAFGDSYSMPTAVYVEDDGNLVIGQIAVSSKMRNPSSFKGEFKRDLGQKEPYIIGSLQFTPEDLYKEIFVHLKDSAEKARGEKVSKAYITYPANYSMMKKGQLEMAARKAGLLDVELIDEPTAAAYCYCSKGKINDGDKLLVYDFGGGTFDVSLIQFTKQGFKQMTESLGLENCGGIDIDRMIFNDIIQCIPREMLENIKYNENFLKRWNAQIMESSVKIKHQLSTTDKYKDLIAVGFETIEYEISREKLNRMIGPLIEETMIPVKNIVKNANLRMDEIDIVLIVGGTCRIPYIKERLSKTIGKNIYNDIDPELAVCKGAALWDKAISMIKDDFDQYAQNDLSDRIINAEANIQDQRKCTVVDHGQGFSIPNDKTVTMNHNRKGKLYIDRKSQFSGAASKMKIYLNDLLMGERLSVGKSVEIDLPEGNYVLQLIASSVKSEKCKFTIDNKQNIVKYECRFNLMGKLCIDRLFI